MSKSKGKMRSKTKIGVRKPPLSLLDWMIYLVSFCLAIGGGIALIPLCIRLRDIILFCDPTVLAVTQVSTELSVFIISMCFLFGFMGFLIKQLSARQPIFGNRKVTYGEFPWKKDLFPLFGSYPQKQKQRRDDYQSRKKRKERIMTLCLLVMFLMLLAAFGGLTGACLHDDHSVTVFGVSDGSLGQTYTHERFERLELSVHYHSGAKGGGYMDYSIKIHMDDGKTRQFCRTDFSRNKPDQHTVALQTMTEIKSLFPPGSITIKGENNLELIIRDYDYDAAQARMLRELFDVE